MNFLNLFGNKLKPKEVNEILNSLSGLPEEVGANTEAVGEINELIGATPLETGKTVTLELADHESRIDTLESAGSVVHIYDATGDNALHSDANGRMSIPEGHILKNKHIPIFSCWNAESSFCLVLPEDMASGEKRLIFLKTSNGTSAVNQTFNVSFMYFD